jgi:hypothetical protein
MFENNSKNRKNKSGQTESVDCGVSTADSDDFVHAQLYEESQDDGAFR